MKSDELKEMQKLERKRRVLKRWAIVLVVAAIVSVGALGLTILDHFLKGTSDGGLEINWNKVDTKLAWLGAEIRDLDAAISAELGLPTTDGVLINDVTADSPADKGGLSRGDVILTANNTTVTNSLQFQELILDSKPGDKLKLTINAASGGKKILQVELGTKPSNSQSTDSTSAIKKVADTTTTLNPTMSTSWGISVAPLTTDARSEYNIPDSEKGILIVSVAQGSSAASQGLEIGDVIEKVNGVPVPNLQAFYGILSKEVSSVVLDIYSSDDGKRFYVTFPDEGDSPPKVVLMDFTTTVETGRLAVPSDREDINGSVYYRFAQAPIFIIYDTRQGEATFIKNPYAAQVRGTGVTVANLLVEQKIDAVIVGGIGPQSYDTFYLAKVKVYGPTSGSAWNAIQSYMAGKLPELKEANIAGYGSSSTAVIPTASSSTTDTTDSDSDGLQKQPSLIPPKGKPEELSLTAGGDPRLNRSDLCICTRCGALVTHPAGTSCSDMVCPICGARLMNASPGNDESGPTDLSTQIPIDTSSPAIVKTAASGMFVSNAPTTTPQSSMQATAGGNLWALSNQPENIPPTNLGQSPMTSSPGTVNTATSGSQVTTCVCPLDGTTVVHPVGIPCASLQCPICGSRMVSGSVTLTGGNPMTATAGIQTSSKPENIPPIQQTFWVPISSKPENIPPTNLGQSPATSSGGTVNTASSTTQVTTCVCPLDGTTVVHPVGIPCASLQCPVCGSRMVSGSVTLTGGSPMTTTAGIQTSSKPENIPPLGQIQTTAYVPVAGGPTSGGPNTGGPTSGGPAIDGSAMGGGQSSSTGAAQTGRSTECVCPMDGTTVTHPIGVPCASLNCPVCGSRLVNAQPAGSTGGAAGMMVQTAGIPTAGMQTAYVPVAGGPTAGGPDTGGPTSGGPAIDGPSMGGSTGGSAQSGRSNECVCPMDGTIVAHPIGVPCASLNCPICGSRLVNATPTGATLTAGGAPTLTGGAPMLTAGAVTVAQSQIVQVAGLSRKVVVPSKGRNVTSEIAPMFDTAPYFLMFGIGTYDVVKNPYARDSRATGTEIAQFVVGEGGAVVIVNNISMAALKTFKDLQVRAYTGFTGTVQQALDIYADGRLKDSGSITGVVVGTDTSEKEEKGPPTSKSKDKTKEKEDTNIF